MEDLKELEQVINLGKLLVDELDLENRTDTLSKWMAHYVAERILLISKLPVGKDKDTAEKDCFETILQLWKHRWFLPTGRRPLESFEPILRVLERLNPDNERPFFYRYRDNDLFDENDKSSSSEEVITLVNTALQIDKVARVWIEHLLQQAALKAKNEKTTELLKNSSNLSDNEDAKIIEVIFDDNQTKEEEETLEKKRKIERLKSRMDTLERFSKFNDALVSIYKNELDNIQKT